MLVDGDKKIPNIGHEQYAVIAGDDKSAAIAAASVVAKVTRDRDMKNYAVQILWGPLEAPESQDSCCVCCFGTCLGKGIT